MKRSIALLFAFLIAPSMAGAWGHDGHVIVAELAQDLLVDQARQQAAALLDGEPLSAVANWADAIRETERPDTSSWHFVNIPIQANRYDASRDCPQDCIVSVTKRLKAILEYKPPLPKPYRAEALKFLVHLIGDIHQPLHCANNDDHGGNDVQVMFFKTPSTLHAVWDEGLIDKSGLSPSRYVELLRKDWLGSQEGTKKLQGGTVSEWVAESHKLAVRYAYRIPEIRVLTGRYFDRNIPIVELQLVRAGARLSRVLNDVLR